jgi:hypothetical protein
LILFSSIPLAPLPSNFLGKASSADKVERAASVEIAAGGTLLGRFTRAAISAFRGQEALPADAHYWTPEMVGWRRVAKLGLLSSAPAQSQDANAQIIVLGMHRSGTSCLAGFLQASGVFFGSPSSFKARAGVENPKGFWERRDLRKICDSLLHSVGLDWDQVAEFDPAKIRPEVLSEQRKAFAQLVNELDAHGVWSIKEPRLCLLLPLLADLVPDAVILHIHRHPASIAASLAERNKLPLPYGLALWEAYNTAALRGTRNMPVLRIAYEDLIGRSRETTEWLRARLRKKHGIKLGTLTDEQLHEVVDPALSRAVVPEEEGNRWLNADQRDLLATLRGESTAAPNPLLSRLCAETLRAFERDHATTALPSQRPAPPTFGRIPQDTSITLVDAAALANADIHQGEETVIVMPSITEARALETARLLVKQAGMRTRIFVVMDHERQGFVKTFNDTAARLSAKYIVYLAEDVYPGRNWLKLARDKLRKSGKGLLAINDGKWRGRIASYGMIRTAWAKKLYGGPPMYPGYRNHFVDNELTVIARASEQFVYSPSSVLLEIDDDKIFQRSKVTQIKHHPSDRSLFKARFEGCFDGLVTQESLEPLRAEYFSAPTLKSPAPQKPHDQPLVTPSKDTTKQRPRSPRKKSHPQKPARNADQ